MPFLYLGLVITSRLFKTALIKVVVDGYRF